MPNIVFSGAVVAPETSGIYRKYIQPVASCDTLPFILFDKKRDWHHEVNQSIQKIYRLMHEQGRCYEMAVQRELSSIFEYIFLNLDELPRAENTRIQLNTQIRMLSYIWEHYAETDIAYDMRWCVRGLYGSMGICLYRVGNGSFKDRWRSDRSLFICGIYGNV